MSSLSADRFGYWTVALAALFAFGCATPPTMRDVEVIEAGTSIVFGSVEVYEDGEQEEWGVKFTGSNYFYLTIYSATRHE